MRGTTQPKLELGLEIHSRLERGDRIRYRGSDVAGTVDSVDHRRGFVKATLDNSVSVRLPLDQIRVLS